LAVVDGLVASAPPVAASLTETLALLVMRAAVAFKIKMQVASVSLMVETTVVLVKALATSVKAASMTVLRVLATKALHLVVTLLHAVTSRLVATSPHESLRLVNQWV
jgi:hypothetical protein